MPNLNVSTYLLLGKSKVDTLNINKEKIKTKTRRVFEQSTQLQLEMEFRSSPYLTSWKRQDLSEKLNLSERQVRVWFQNRRMRVKNEKRNKRRHREFDKTINITQSYLTTGRLHMGHWTSSQASYYSLLATSESADNFFASDNLPNGYYSSIDYQPILSNVFYDPSFLLQHPVTNETYAAAQYQYQDDTFSKL